GVLSGMFGVGGGILFVPTLVALGLGQVEAGATSLLAIVPTAAVGVWRQRRYGNLRPAAAAILGLASIGGVEAGVQIATALPEHALRRLFGVLLLVVAAQLALRARPRRRSARGQPGRRGARRAGRAGDGRRRADPRAGSARGVRSAARRAAGGEDGGAGVLVPRRRLRRADRLGDGERGRAAGRVGQRAGADVV